MLKPPTSHQVTGYVHYALLGSWLSMFAMCFRYCTGCNAYLYCHTWLQSQEAQAPNRKRSRPPSAETIQPKEEAEELGEPASQIRRTGDTQQGQQPSGALQSIDSLQGASEAAGQASTPAADNAAAVPPAAEAPVATGDGTAAAAEPAHPVDNASQPVASAAARAPMENGETAEASKQGEVSQQSLGDPGADGKESQADGMGETTGATQGDALDSSQRVEEHFQPSLPMQEMVVNFLLRMAFVIGGDRDHDLQVWCTYSICWHLITCHVL